MQSPFHRDRVGFDEQRLVQRHQAVVDRAGFGGIATHGGGAQVAHGARSDVGGHRDVAATAHQHQLDSGGVIAGIDQEVLADAVQHFLAALQVASGFLDADDVLHLGQTLDGLRQHVAGGTAGHVVEDLRDRHGFGDMAEMLVQAFLGRLVVVRGHQQAGIRATGLGGFGQLHGFASGIGAGTGDHRNTAVDLVNHATDNFKVLAHVESGRLARGADRYDGIGAFLQVEIHQLREAVPIQSTLSIEGGDQRHHTARNHATTPAGKRKE
ncbi:hypothetical protein D3C81_1041830 [compost metagenome]